MNFHTSEPARGTRNHEKYDGDSYDFYRLSIATGACHQILGLPETAPSGRVVVNAGRRYVVNDEANTLDVFDAQGDRLAQQVPAIELVGQMGSQMVFAYPGDMIWNIRGDSFSTSRFVDAPSGIEPVAARPARPLGAQWHQYQTRYRGPYGHREPRWHRHTTTRMRAQSVDRLTWQSTRHRGGAGNQLDWTLSESTLEQSPVTRHAAPLPLAGAVWYQDTGLVGGEDWLYNIHGQQRVAIPAGPRHIVALAPNLHGGDYLVAVGALATGDKWVMSAQKHHRRRLGTATQPQLIPVRPKLGTIIARAPGQLLLRWRYRHWFWVYRVDGTPIWRAVSARNCQKSTAPNRPPDAPPAVTAPSDRMTTRCSHGLWRRHTPRYPQA